MNDFEQKRRDDDNITRDARGRNVGVYDRGSNSTLWTVIIALIVVAIVAVLLIALL